MRRLLGHPPVAPQRRSEGQGEPRRSGADDQHVGLVVALVPSFRCGRMRKHPGSGRFHQVNPIGWSEASAQDESRRGGDQHHGGRGGQVLVGAGEDAVNQGSSVVGGVVDGVHQPGNRRLPPVPRRNTPTSSRIPTARARTPPIAGSTAGSPIRIMGTWIAANGTAVSRAATSPPCRRSSRAWTKPANTVSSHRWMSRKAVAAAGCP